jgi:dipeptidyl aminopeptidase/acylaminoacyl peptidase
MGNGLMTWSRAPFGTWPSPITSDAAIAGSRRFAELSSDGDALYWLESRPEERGRTTLMRHDGVGTHELTPAPLNIRSRVHEYGGGAYLAAGDRAFVIDFEQQNVHALDIATGTLRQITHSDASERFADPAFDRVRGRLICVCERHQGNQVLNSIVAIDLADGRTIPLHAEHDFYASPRVSPDGRQLCFVSWDHPNMPWDGTQLHVAALEEDGTLGPGTVVAGGASEAIVQPEFIGAATRLIFASDRSGWWNLYSYDESGLYCVHEDSAEYAVPHWQFARRTFAAVSRTILACQRIENGAESIVLVDVDSGMATPVASGWRAYDGLTSHRGGVAFIGHRPDSHSAIVRLDLRDGGEHTLAVAGELPVAAEFLSHAEAIVFPTRDGAVAHAYLYAPTHPGYDGLEGEQPPLLVLSHGGPTSATRPALNFRIQYYTSRGWAVVDVNYRGSTGFGRAYRNHLHGRWGIVDVQDCEDAVVFLAAQDRIDSNRVAICGGSAGGFTTLAALCFSRRFRAGASHYGVADLEALARDTHKFEARYLDSLIGPYPEQEALYRARSPIHHVDRIECPVIVLQGLKDPVVPPNQAEAIVRALLDKQLPVAYVTFADEQHGFRDAANIRRALEAEHTFFARVFGIDAPGLADLEINNL